MGIATIAQPILAAACGYSNSVAMPLAAKAIAGVMTAVAFGWIMDAALIFKPAWVTK